MQVAISNIADKFKLKFKRLLYDLGPKVRPGLYKRIPFVQEQPNIAKCLKSMLFDFLFTFCSLLVNKSNATKCHQA